MADLKELIGLKGVLAAGEFSADGELVAYEGDLNKELAQMIALMCAADSMILKFQSHSFTRASGMPGFEEAVGFSVSGPQLSVCVRGNRGVFVKNDEVSFDEVFRELEA